MKIFENYRMKRARRDIDNPLLNAARRNNNRTFWILTVVFVMACIAYVICFFNRTPVIPNTFANKNRNIHIVSTIDFSYKSDILTKQRGDLNAERIPPLYKIAENSVQNATELKNKLLSFFASNQEKYEASVKEQHQKEFAKEMSEELKKSTIFVIQPNDILNIYALIDEKQREDIFSHVNFYVSSILSNGVYADDDKVFKESKDWINPSSNVNTATSKHAVSETRANAELADSINSLGVNKQLAKILYRVFYQCINPNIIFDEEKTKQIKDAARADVKPVEVKVRVGETLADSASINTAIAKERINAYRTEIERRGEGDFTNAPKIINFIVCFLLMLLAALFIIVSRSQVNKRQRTIYVFCTLLILNLLIQRSIITFTNTELINNSSTLLQILLYATPLFIGPIIQVLLFGAYMGFIMAIVVATLTTMMLSEGIPFFVLNLAASLIAIYICNGATNRYRVIFAGTSYGTVVAIVVATFGLCVDAPLFIVGEQTIAAFIGGITTGILALAILPIIEFIFKTNSNISLLDYTDLNDKKAHLLKTLQLIAPGTYHHSVMVSYLAEAAAQAVKANSMVCRVGALYHDIGKLSKPEFFSENQKEVNPHDEQNPSMSALIIKNHVSDGVAKAEVEKMPRQIVHAIKQHHGTSIIAYFFNKAKKKAEASGRSVADFRQIMREEGIEESTYRHDGQKPQTVENAIIMIADSCEAASRSMKKPTKHGIETMVEAIVNSKMTDGQLDECPITVKQISIIKRTISDTLMNMLHSRVDYKKVH